MTDDTRPTLLKSNILTSFLQVRRDKDNGVREAFVRSVDTMMKLGANTNIGL